MNKRRSRLDLTTRQIELETKKALNQTDPNLYPSLSDEEAAELEKIPGELILVNAKISESQGQLAILTQLGNGDHRRPGAAGSDQSGPRYVGDGFENDRRANRIRQRSDRTARQTLIQAKADADKQIAEGEAKLKQGQKDIAQGEIELALNKAKGEAELEDAREELVLAKNKIEQIEQGKCYILDRQSHYSYMDYKGRGRPHGSDRQGLPGVFLPRRGVSLSDDDDPMVDGSARRSAR